MPCKRLRMGLCWERRLRSALSSTSISRCLLTNSTHCCPPRLMLTRDMHSLRSMPESCHMPCRPDRALLVFSWRWVARPAGSGLEWAWLSQWVLHLLGGQAMQSRPLAVWPAVVNLLWTLSYAFSCLGLMHYELVACFRHHFVSVRYVVLRRSPSFPSAMVMRVKGERRVHIAQSLFRIAGWHGQLSQGPLVPRPAIRSSVGRFDAAHFIMRKGEGDGK
jgi:hypothetical protein